MSKLDKIVAALDRHSITIEMARELPFHGAKTTDFDLAMAMALIDIDETVRAEVTDDR